LYREAKSSLFLSKNKYEITKNNTKIKNQNILYLTDNTKFHKFDLNIEIINATSKVTKNIKTNVFNGKSSRIFNNFSLLYFLAKNQTTKIDKIMIKTSFHIQIAVHTHHSNPSQKVTNVCKKNCNNNTHKKIFVINAKLFFIQLIIY